MIEHLNDPELIKTLWKPYTKELGIPYMDWINQYVRDNAFYCYKVDGHIAGFCGYHVYNRKKKVTVEALVVLPEYRGRGIATKLIAQQYKDTQSLIKTLGYEFTIEGQAGLPNNQVYDHLSVKMEPYWSKSGKLEIYEYWLDTDRFDKEIENNDLYI